MFPNRRKSYFKREGERLRHATGPSAFDNLSVTFKNLWIHLSRGQPGCNVYTIFMEVKWISLCVYNELLINTVLMKFVNKLSRNLSRNIATWVTLQCSLNSLSNAIFAFIASIYATQRFILQLCLFSAPQVCKASFLFLRRLNLGKDLNVCGT